MPLSSIALLVPNGQHGKLERRYATPQQLAGVLSAEVPVQRGYRWIEEPELGLFMSVWDSTPLTFTSGPFPNNEMFLVVDGSVTIVEPGGHETTFRAGDCFIFPQGFVNQWKQTEYFRKYAVGFMDASWQPPADPGTIKLVRIDASGPLGAAAGPPTEAFVGPVPAQHERRWFADQTGQMTVRVWDTTACHLKPRITQAHEWTHVLEGSVTLTDAAGMAHHFKKGDTFVVPLGIDYEWQCPAYFRAIHCTFQPKVAAAKAQAAE
jgi:uncharacterized cupin superfamily protein